jgi:hypothetical protein
MYVTIKKKRLQTMYVYIYTYVYIHTLYNIIYTLYDI